MYDKQLVGFIVLTAMTLIFGAIGLVVAYQRIHPISIFLLIIAITIIAIH